MGFPLLVKVHSAATSGVRPPKRRSRVVEVGKRGAQVLGAEVRPHVSAKQQLRVGAFPEQEIREPLLAAGADQQVDVAPGAVALPRQQPAERGARGESSPSQPAAAFAIASRAE